MKKFRGNPAGEGQCGPCGPDTAQLNDYFGPGIDQGYLVSIGPLQGIMNISALASTRSSVLQYQRL